VTHYAGAWAARAGTGVRERGMLDDAGVAKVESIDPETAAISSTCAATSGRTHCFDAHFAGRGGPPASARW